MAVAGKRLLLIIVLAIVGAYFLLFHAPPFPLNHEEVGLGTLHIAHDIIGLLLIAGAVIVWWQSRTIAVPSQAPAAKQ